MNNKKEQPAPPVLLAQIGFLYQRLYRECEHLFREQAFPLDFDQIPVLLTLYYRGPSSQQEIYSRLQRDKASVNRTVAFLTKNAITTVSMDAVDRRKTVVKLTPAGEKLAHKANALIEKYDATLSSALTNEEREQFNKLMNKMIATADSNPFAHPPA